MPRFRPLPILTLFSALALALLIALGSWQVRRMTWKNELIAAYESRGEVSGFRAALCEPHKGPFGPSVTGPAPISGQTLRYYTLRGEPGWVLVGLMPAPECEAAGRAQFLFVETAFESLAGERRTPARAWRIDPLPAAGTFTSRNDPDTNQWYSFDREAMAGALGVPPDRVMQVWARSDHGLPLSLSQTPPVRHFGYALTWYGLALALIGVYLVFHAKRGRLHWR